MKLLGSAKKDVDQDKYREDVPKLVIRPGGWYIPPPRLIFSETKKNINLKVCMIVFLEINFQKIIFIVSCRWMF